MSRLSQIENMADYLSDTSMKLTISNVNSGNKNTIPNLNTILSFLDKEKCDFLLYKDFVVANGKGVYFSGNRFTPEIIKGRSFLQSDFTKKTKTVLINELLVSKCISKGEKNYFVYENQEYEVIGVFKSNYSKNNFNPLNHTDFFINLAALSENEITSSISGQYYLDTGENTYSVYSKLANLLRSQCTGCVIEGMFYKMDTFSSLKYIFGERQTIFIALFLSVILLVLNVFSATANWIDGRKKELSIRRLAGARIINIKLLLLKDYLFITTTGYLFGLILSVTVTASKIIPYIKDYTIDLRSIIFSFILCLIIGAFSGSIFLGYYIRREIVHTLR